MYKPVSLKKKKKFGGKGKEKVRYQEGVVAREELLGKMWTERVLGITERQEMGSRREQKGGIHRARFWRNV